MRWAALLHIYQPPHWDARVIAKVVSESYRPLVDILTRNPKIKITLNINASLTEQLARHGYLDVIDGLRSLAERGQIEFTGSAKYHPILPLLPADEVRRQIRLNTETNRALFGDIYRPRGFFPPEMAVDLDLIRILVEMGFEWVAVDELAGEKKLGDLPLNKKYLVEPFDISLVLRNRFMSDYLAFAAPIDKPGEFFAEVEKEKRSKEILITAMDGENLGHHRPGTERLWEELVTNPSVEMVTFTEALEGFSTQEKLMVQESSWSTRAIDRVRNAPYPLWQHPENQLHQLQWSLTTLIIEAINQAEKRSDHTIEQARIALDEALSSDQYWWASATPWWSVEIINEGAERLGKVLEALSEVPPATQKEARQLIRSIRETSRRWQDKGVASQRMAEYNKETKQVHYMAGQRIDGSAK
ncbi:MAG: hypothetical protein H6760_04725 [Candidatus Nomurabacteria bacterium]|nr:MAG: hypothetical protein H6760_04725 [Candidatus Nomurabacteria bacterium]